MKIVTSEFGVFDPTISFTMAVLLKDANLTLESKVSELLADKVALKRIVRALSRSIEDEVIIV